VLGWAEAKTAVGTALFPLPRPPGPLPLPPAVLRPLSGQWPLARLPEAVPSGLLLPSSFEVVSLPSQQAPSQRLVLLFHGGKRLVGIPGLSRQSRVLSQGRALFIGKPGVLSHLLHLSPSLRPE
jgi:hypothetical protein